MKRRRNLRSSPRRYPRRSMIRFVRPKLGRQDLPLPSLAKAWPRMTGQSNRLLNGRHRSPDSSCLSSLANRSRKSQGGRSAMGHVHERRHEKIERVSSARRGQLPPGSPIPSPFNRHFRSRLTCCLLAAQPVPRRSLPPLSLASPLCRGPAETNKSALVDRSRVEFPRCE